MFITWRRNGGCGVKLRAIGRATLQQVLNGIYVFYKVFLKLLQRC